MKHLLIFGFGFSAAAIAKRAASEGFRITGTARSDDGMARIKNAGFTAVRFDAMRPFPEPLAPDVTHVVVSIPPTNRREANPAPDTPDDPVLHNAGAALAALRHLEWIGYLSTVGVYGDHDGAWVDELTRPAPASERSLRRFYAEEAWRRFAGLHARRLNVFRLAGIYGPGRNPIENLRRGRARIVIKPGQVFNRIHVDDIADTVIAAIEAPESPVTINVTDDEPASPQDVFAYASELTGLALPALVAIEDADLTPMAKSFYGECKRVSNARMKALLGRNLSYPTFREGLRSLADAHQRRG